MTCNTTVFLGVFHAAGYDFSHLSVGSTDLGALHICLQGGILHAYLSILFQRCSRGRPGLVGTSIPRQNYQTSLTR
jgi:hypothetical protein